MRVKLKDAFNLQMGKTPSRADLSLWGGNNKWISIADIGSAKKYISSTKECITDEGVSRSGIKVVPNGTVIMSFKLSIGKTAIVSEDMYTNEAIMAFIDNGTYCIDPNYLYHLCCGTDWTQGGNKAVMGLTLNKATLSEMEIELPTIEEQREIASILDQLDAIIEKRHDELNMIEQLVKSRFIELFESGNYPVCRLGDVCSKITDGTHKTPNYLDAGVTFISAKNIVNGELDFSDVKYISDQEYAEIQKRCQTEMGDILLSKSGSLGAPVIVKTTERIGLFESLAVIKYDRSKLLPAFLCEQLKSDRIQRQFKVGTKGVAIKHLHLGVIADTDIVVPPIEDQNAFAAFVEQTDKSKFFACQTLSFLLKLANNLQSWREKQYDY